MRLAVRCLLSAVRWLPAAPLARICAGSPRAAGDAGACWPTAGSRRQGQPAIWTQCNRRSGGRAWWRRQQRASPRATSSAASPISRRRRRARRADLPRRRGRRGGDTRRRPPAVPSGTEARGDRAGDARRPRPAATCNPTYRAALEVYRAGATRSGDRAVSPSSCARTGKSDLADNAQYWIGEAYYSSGDYNRAIIELNEVLLKYPQGDQVPGALLALATAFANSGDPDRRTPHPAEADQRPSIE